MKPQITIGIGEQHPTDCTMVVRNEQTGIEREYPIESRGWRALCDMVRTCQQMTSGYGLRPAWLWTWTDDAGYRCSTVIVVDGVADITSDGKSLPPQPGQITMEEAAKKASDMFHLGYPWAHDAMSQKIADHFYRDDTL